MKRKNLAFSMAEVMITLVIIGAIAVLTVPGLVDSSNKRVNDAATAKADYVASQAALRLQAECPRLRCFDNTGENAAKSKLETLLTNVKANEKITYKVSKKVDNAPLYILATIDGDDAPILYSVDDKGKGERVESSGTVTTVFNGEEYFTSDQKSGISCVRIERDANNKDQRVAVAEGADCSD